MSEKMWVSYAEMSRYQVELCRQDDNVCWHIFFCRMSFVPGSIRFGVEAKSLLRWFNLEHD